MPLSSALEAQLIEDGWFALTGDAEEARVVEHPVLRGAAGALTSRFAASEIATACVASALMAAASLQARRGGTGVSLALDRGQVAAAVRSERYFRHGGSAAGMGFALLSRFWRARDGWVRTHANYPWHRAALLATLGVTDDEVAVAAAIAERTASAVEEEVFAAGGIAAAVRSVDEWHGHPQGEAVGREPLISHQRVGDAPARTHEPGDLPATGVRVLDLTRVIAGPVCTRYLGALGADVLRVDPPDHPDMQPGILGDTLLGKRSTLLDARTAEGVAALHELLHDADVLVCGYRPGALEGFGVSEADVADRHPGVVVVYLDAWGHTGPWSGRRGFDSVVQAPTGIALGESDDGEVPGALPCQLLDHGTGYLAAAAVLDGLHRQARDGGTHVRRVSLARTATWITSTPSPPDDVRPDDEGDAVDDWLQHIHGRDGSLSAIAPPGALGGTPLHWPPMLTRYGEDAPQWSSAE